VTGGTATAGDDFRDPGTVTVTIPANALEGEATFTFEPENDNVDEGLSETVVFGSASPPSGLTVRTATLTLADDDGKGIELSAGPVRLTEDPRDGEGTGGTYTVALATEPTGDVTVQVSVSGNRDVTVSPARLTFTALNWNQPQTVTVRAAHDGDAAPDTAMLNHRASGADYGGVRALPLAVEIRDVSVRGVTVTPTALDLREGGQDTYTVVLHTIPTGTVTVTPTVTGDDSVTVSPTRLSFTASNWNRPRTVTVRAAQDLDQTEDTATVENAVSGADYGENGETAASVSVTVSDDDTPSTVVRLSISADSVREGGGAQRFTVTAELNAAPEPVDTEVELTLSAGTAQPSDFVASGPVTLTVPAGQVRATAQVTVQPVEDLLDEEDETLTITATIADKGTDSQLATLDPASFDVTITDNDMRGLTVSPLALTVLEGGSGTYTVRLTSQPTSTVTVTPSPPPGADLTMQPASLSFTASNWNEPQTVTVTAADDADVEEDAVFDIEHRVSGGDYGTNNVTAAPVKVTVPGFEESPDGMVMLKPPSSGERTVTVPEGTSVPAGLQVTIPAAQDPNAVLTVMIADDAPNTMPQGFRAGDAVVDIDLADGSELTGEAVVCLPGRGRVFRYDEDAAEWVKLEPPAGGSPSGLACGVTDSFSLFALGSAPFAAVVRSWTVRFGRTVADQVVAAAESRFAAAPRPGVEISVAGQRVGSAGPVPKNDEARPQLNSMSAQLRDGSRAGTGFETGFETDRDRLRRSHGRAVSNHDLLTGTSFSMTAENEDGGGEFVSVWGRGAITRFSGGGNGRGLDGEVSSFMAGADWTRAPVSKSGAGAWTAGLLVAQSRGTGSFKGETEGKIESNLTGFYPYGRYALNDRIGLWGVAGYGEGTLKLKPEGDTEEIKTDLALGMAATGLRGVVIEAPKEGGPELAAKTDALYVRTTTAAVSSEDLEATEAAVTRLRLGLEGTWRGLKTGSGEMTPSLEVGLRLDNGDAETGFGLDAGGGVSWSDRSSGLSAELRGRGLLTHESRAFRDRGFSGSLAWKPGEGTGRGPSLSLTQTVGAAAAGGADALLSRETMAGLAANDNGGDELENRRLEAKLGYGIPAFGDRFTSTPELGVGLSDGGRRDYRLGWRLGLIPRRRLSSFGLGLEATRTEPANDAGSGAEPDHGIRFKLDARF